MKKAAYLFLFLPAMWLAAQEIPVTETEAEAHVDIADEAVTDDLVLSQPNADEAPIAQLVTVDEALVWDTEAADDEPLPAIAEATAAVPILHRAEYEAKKEWETLTTALTLSDESSRLLLSVLTDTCVKQIRISEDKNLKRSAKKVRLNFLRYEKESRLKSMFDKEQFKLYKKLNKAKLKEESVSR